MDLWWAVENSDIRQHDKTCQGNAAIKWLLLTNNELRNVEVAPFSATFTQKVSTNQDAFRVA